MAVGPTQHKLRVLSGGFDMGEQLTIPVVGFDADGMSKDPGTGHDHPL
ncbi:hypothetical protein GCM10009525_54310 [Streptosporangium amethystogenes subsp. fukuiense]